MSELRTTDRLYHVPVDLGGTPHYVDITVSRTTDGRIVGLQVSAPTTVGPHCVKLITDLADAIRDAITDEHIAKAKP